MEKVIVIGTGKEAEAFLYNFKGIYDVVFFADDAPRRNCFRGKSVVTLDSIIFRLDGTYKVVIATSIEEYVNISRRLQHNKLREFEDYIYYKAIGKKVAMFYGNCHCVDVKFYMSKIPEFVNKYWIYPNLAICEGDTWWVSDDVYSNIDLLIYQNVRQESNGLLYSTDYIISMLKKDAIVIRMPNLFLKGYGWFPQSHVIKIALLRAAELDFIVNSHNQDAIIRKLYKEGKSEEEICDIILNGEIWNKEEIQQKFMASMDLIKEEDEECNIKIYNYIVDNYRNKLVFIDAGHVSNDIYKEYIMQILNIIGIKYEKINDVLELRDHYQTIPIYGCVARTLGFSYYTKNQIIKRDTYCLTDEPLSVLEYVKQYVYMCVDNRTI